MKRGVLVAGGLASGLLILGLYVWNARRPLSDRAGTAFEAMMRGDAKALMAYASEREAKEEGLTQENLQKVLDRLLLPYVAQVDRSKEPVTSDDTGNYHATWVRDVVAKDGRVVPLGFDLWLGDDGAFTNVLTAVLNTSWQLRHAGPGRPRQPGDYFRISLEGLREDREFLQSVGLRGLVPPEPDQPFVGWAKIESNCVRKVSNAPQSR